MAIESDVLVIGGGLAGMMAATAAAEAGANTRLVTHTESTLQQASGLIDLLGYIGDAGPVVDPFDVLDSLPDDHPYAIVGESAIHEGFAAFDDRLGDRYRGGDTTRNALVMTSAGNPKPTARYPESVAPGLLSVPEDTLLVGFDTVTEFDAEYAADRLAAAGVPFDVDGATVPFPGSFETDAALTRLSRALDENEPVAVDGHRRPIRRALADAIVPYLDDADRVGFPALLGRHDSRDVRRDLEARLGGSVFEIPTGPPSLLGARLADGLAGAVAAAGVHVTRGVEIMDATVTDGRADALTARYEHNEMEYHARQYVLATGGLVGKGIASDRTTVTEPVFGCQIDHSVNRYDWSREDAFGPHAFPRFGVDVDEELRPSIADGRLANVRAAGSVIGGFDFAADCAGSGVSIATGHLAGTLAAEAVIS